MDHLFSKISKLLQAARDAGAEPAEIAEMRRHFKMTTDWSPTKKRVSPEKRKARRKQQKLSRRANRGTTKGQPNRKGYRRSRARA